MSIYLDHFGLSEPPFAITPDPRYVYLSRRHEDALAHLLYGIGQGGSGGFVQLTGEVGTGKTTLCRCLLEQIPEKTRIALILNPMLKPRDLLQAICDELHLQRGRSDSSRELVNRLYAHLLEAHGNGERVVLVIDEAQNMSRDSLEQVRLLTNLETHTDKLLQIILLGQPELRELLARNELRQLAQRITARYHLQPLDPEETEAYVKHRLAVAGCRHPVFRRGAYRTLYQLSGGVPRLINILADRALLGAYAGDNDRVSSELLKQAGREVSGDYTPRGRSWLGMPMWAAAAMLVLLLSVAGYAGYRMWPAQPDSPDTPLVAIDSAGPAKAVSGLESNSEPDSMESSTGDQPASAVGAVVAEAITDSAANTEPDDPSAEPAPPPFSEWLNITNSDEVWLRWARIWGLEAQRVTTACQQADAEDGDITGVFCTRQPGGWSRIRQLNLPVLIDLASTDTPLLVEGLENGKVLLHNGQQRYWWPLHQLRDVWRGGYTAVCPGATGAWREGMRDPEIQRLKTLAGNVPDQPFQGSPDEQFGAPFADWVAGFQSRNGLAADRILGQESKLFLCAAAGNGPRLLTSSGNGLPAEGE